MGALQLGKSETCRHLILGFVFDAGQLFVCLMS